MAGIFGFFDYTKPGPGIEKNAPAKSRFVVFFEIFSRKFWNLVKINMMFTLFNLPAILAVLFVSSVFIQKSVSQDFFTDFAFKFILGAVFLCIPLVTVGPAQAGFTYILRNYAREEHSFIWSDFKEHAFKNLKQSIIICLIDLAVVIVVGLDINIYMKMQTNMVFTEVAAAFLTLAFVIYLMMHMYIYPMLVTFKLSIKEIYKNALIFSLIKFLPNLGILAITFSILFLTFIAPVIGFILFPFITVSTIGLLTNFYVYPNLKKYIIDKIDQQGDEVKE